MLLLSRKVSSLSISITSPSLFPVSLSRLTNMTSINNSDGALSRLALLARQLRLYKRPPSPGFDGDGDDDGDKGVSQVGFPESVTSVADQPPEKFISNRAAVLICLFEGKNDDGDGLRVILTKRSSGLSTHSGEVSLPGGKAEEDDVDDADTATREAKEEIGLNPSLHLLRVIPVIGILSDQNAFTPTPNIAEVDDVFDAPLDMFLKDENRRSEEREWMGDRYLVHYFDYETGGKKYMIWGLTAGILIRAASIVYQRPPAFLEQSPKIPRVLNKGTILP
ncbi:NUDIX hydrolase domain-containing protein [Cynara cardunculus var. scolymus]|uniref:NUDIX hydrolase domain-containing protein n=1 Tax=Cynara cardunculus var. scolymus TaxID=59895 RepID=A0A118JUU8_CYNCS|nr:NUDIX hydrolase domain-containing protein [Cynara cardunculus var. scolymus]